MGNRDDDEFAFVLAVLVLVVDVVVGVAGVAGFGVIGFVATGGVTGFAGNWPVSVINASKRARIFAEEAPQLVSISPNAILVTKNTSKIRNIFFIFL